MEIPDDDEPEVAVKVEDDHHPPRQRRDERGELKEELEKVRRKKNGIECEEREAELQKKLRELDRH